MVLSQFQPALVQCLAGNAFCTISFTKQAITLFSFLGECTHRRRKLAISMQVPRPLVNFASVASGKRQQLKLVRGEQVFDLEEAKESPEEGHEAHVLCKSQCDWTSFG